MSVSTVLPYNQKKPYRFSHDFIYSEVKKRVEQHRYSFSTPKKVLNRKGTLVSIEEQIEEKKTKSELAAHIWSLKEKRLGYHI